MGFVSGLSYLGATATFAQVLLALPMTLDLLGAPSFLLLSLLLTFHHFLYSSLRLLLKNTPFSPFISILSFVTPAISASLVLLTFYYHLHPPSTGFGHILVDVLPYGYASVLRWVSPVFTLLEGISTLLVVQVTGRVGKGWADEEDKEEGVEWRSLTGLVVAALVYCAGLAGVLKIFPLIESFPAFLLGTALASVVFLSLIGFSLRRTNVLETSLVFVYVVYSAWLSTMEAQMEPRQYGYKWLSPSPSWISATTTGATVQSLASRGLSGIFDSIVSVARTLPSHSLLSLIYRVAVLHFASRIIPQIRKTAAGWNDGMEETRAGSWDGKSLQEPTNMRVTTIVLGYRRAILIAVYTHLLLLDGGSQEWWRWINITLFLAVWSLELLLDADDDAESVSRWKVD